MQRKTTYYGFGILSFVVALITMLLTVQSSVPFWDCGEFSTASVWQQVPHPPGAPLFLMFGKLFHVLIPFGDDGWRINMVSVLASAFTVWLAYLIIVKLIRNFRKEDILTLADEIAVYGSAFVGAVTLTFCDTFWFNAVESEVYAASTLFVTIIIYLMMRWNEVADKPGNERYLLLIAYLIGLSTGVHLLSILTIFSLVMLVYYRKYQFQIGSFILMSVIALVVFFVIYPGIVQWIPTILAGNLPFKNDCKEYIVEGSPVITVLAIVGIITVGIGFWLAHKKHYPIVKLATLSFLLMLFGYSTYTQILLRSNANPPMNENAPKNFSTLAFYLGREQYGEAPNWPRRYQQENNFINNYIKKDADGEYIYGEWFPPEREKVECKHGSAIMIPEYKKTNFGGELAYLFKFQIYHMYIRYLLWNFIGRTSDIQEAGFALDGKEEADELNNKSGYKNDFPIRFYALPLLFGLIGLIYHFRKDPKYAFIFSIMFLMMGVLAAIQQNQQEPQVRERDYFYAGSFLVYCMWIGLGAYGLINWISRQKKPLTAISAAVVLVATILVPVNMAYGGWKIHSRAGNYLPFDHSYNILQSTEKDAILFTNGDNDTFPLWYLQDVAGVRRDVRIVNLTLGNALWYIHQLKHRQPWGAKKISLSGFSDETLTVEQTDENALSADLGEAMNVSIPVSPDILKKYTDDPEVIKSGVWNFTFIGQAAGVREGKQYYKFRVQDMLILQILKECEFKRPVYFSKTVSGDIFCGLDKYFRYEGMAVRICPVEQKGGSARAIDMGIMEKCLMNIDNSNNYHKEPHFGFKFRNLANTDVFYDEAHSRLIPNYRQLYLKYAANMLARTNDNKKTIAALDMMNKYISAEQFPISYEFLFRIAKIYNDAGATAKAKEFAGKGIAACNEIIENPFKHKKVLNREAFGGRFYGPYKISAMLYEMLGDYVSARSRLEQLNRNTNEAYNTIKGNAAYKNEAQQALFSMYELRMNIDSYKIRELESQGRLSEALKLANDLLNQYRNSNNPAFQDIILYLEERIQDLQKDVDSSTVMR